MPRSLDAVWNYFEKSSERKANPSGTQQHFIAICNFCKTSFSGQPKRMKLHLCKHCPNVPQEVKKQYLKPKNKNNNDDDDDDDDDDGGGDYDNDDKDDNGDDSNDSSNETNTIVARAFYASGIPLATIENAFFIQALHKINSEYHPPSRKVLSTTLLEKEYKQISANIKNQVKNANYVCLISDGWTNIHQESIINFMVTTPQPIFWKALETKESSHTGDYIAQQFDTVIREIGSSKIAAIITDNASNMKKAHKILHEKYSNIIFLGKNFNLI
jgi:Protein of unknown function (DUF 659)/BED zinc finger